MKSGNVQYRDVKVYLRYFCHLINVTCEDVRTIGGKNG